MLNGRRRWLAAGAVGAMLAIGAGAGIAASSGDGDGFLADVARRLGITEQKLSNAIRDARIAQIDEAVKAGDLTEEQGERLKERVRSGEGPLLGPGHGRGGFGGFDFDDGPFERRGAGILDAAAEFLGVTRAELFESLRGESTLAEVARAKGKSVDGLKAAIRKEVQAQLDQAVEDGALTKEQADRMAEELGERVDRIVDEGFRGRGMRFHGPGPFGPFGPDRDGPDDDDDPDASFEIIVPAPGAGTF